MQIHVFTKVIVPPPPGVPLLPSAGDLRLLTLTEEEEEEGENDENSASDSSPRGGRMFQYDPSYYESREEAFARGEDGRVWHLEEEEEEEKVNIDEKIEFEMGKTVLQLQEKQQNGNYSGESEEEWEYFDEAAEARAEEDRTKLIKVLKNREMMIV